MTSASFEITGIEDVKITFQAIAAAAGDMTEVLDQASAIILNKVRTRFLNTEAPDGSQWPVSAASLIRATTKGQTVGGKTFKDGKTLFMSGKLFHSIQAMKQSKNSRAIYTNIHYASYHNDGTKKLPARVFLGFSKEDINIIQKLANKRLSEALK